MRNNGPEFDYAFWELHPRALIRTHLLCSILALNPLRLLATSSEFPDIALNSYAHNNQLLTTSINVQASGEHKDDLS